MYQSFDTTRIHSFYNAIKAVTAHWLDSEFKFHEVVLGFRQIRRQHKGENISSLFLNILMDFDMIKVFILIYMLMEKHYLHWFLHE